MPTNTAALINRYVTELRPEIAKQVQARRRNANLENCIAAARRIEREIRPLKRKYPPRTRKHHPRSERARVPQTPWRDEQVERRRATAQPRVTPSKTQGEKSPRERRPIVCWTCERKGHISPKCPNKTVGTIGAMRRARSERPTEVKLLINQIKRKVLLDSSSFFSFIREDWANGKTLDEAPKTV